MRLTFIPFNPLHETKDRVRHLLLKATAKRYEKEYSRIGERMCSANISGHIMVLILAESLWREYRRTGVHGYESRSNQQSG